MATLTMPSSDGGAPLCSFGAAHGHFMRHRRTRRRGVRNGRHEFRQERRFLHCE